MDQTLRQLPSVHQLLEAREVRRLLDIYGHGEVADALRLRLGMARAALRSGACTELPDFTSPPVLAEIEGVLEAQHAASLQPVVNATGIIVHTNLGRAPLAEPALDAVRTLAGGYSNLELDLETGRRGSRHAHVERVICELTGAEAALVVNNCAAAVLASLSALAGGHEVIASRGELIEIGGAFRMPDVIAQSGARLVEVGATNKTRIDDYEGAITAETAVLLKSHTSNFRMVGFTEAPSRAELAGLARREGLICMEDLGSGVLIDLRRHGLPDEPVVAEAFHDGVDLVTFSGDKLLGGPQAGIIAGREDLIARLRTHPLMRAVRIDKLSLAALDATLRLYRPPHDPVAEIPVLQALARPLDDLHSQARSLAGHLMRAGGGGAEGIATKAYAGAGSLPQQDLDSFAVALSHAEHGPDTLAKGLRRASPAILGRIQDDRLLLDMRGVRGHEIDLIAQALDGVLRT